ncbi:MAG: GrpB family protein [Luteolibacter sp.]
MNACGCAGDLGQKMIIGLKRGNTRLVPHQLGWCNAFMNEKERLTGLLGNAIIQVEHIGSTAIPQLAAKPIIDIAIGVQSLEVTLSWPAILGREGYTYFGDRESRGDDFYAKGPEENRTIYLHVVPKDGLRWREYLFFRDALRADDDLRKKYENLKMRLSVCHVSTRACYTSAKTELISEILSQCPTNR